MTHAISWFELPSTDFDRAVEFYTAVLDREIDMYTPEEDEPDTGRAGMFQTDEDEVGGMITEADEFTAENGATIPYTPSADSGALVYLNVEGDLDDVLSRVETGGGEVLIPKESIPEMEGHYAVVTDTEGNRVGFISDE